MVDAVEGERRTVTVAVSAVGYTLSPGEVQRATDAYLKKRRYMGGYMRDLRANRKPEKAGQG